MIIAGALCGLCLAWSYASLMLPSAASWLRLNLFYVAMLLLLGVTSLLVFEPGTTIVVLVTADEFPAELIEQALPLTSLFVLGSAIALSLRCGWSRRSFAVSLTACATLVLLLGLNVSILGLVEISRGSLRLVAELVGLIVMLWIAYGMVFLALERRSLRGARPGAGRRQRDGVPTS